MCVCVCVCVAPQRSILASYCSRIPWALSLASWSGSSAGEEAFPSIVLHHNIYGQAAFPVRCTGYIVVHIYLAYLTMRVCVGIDTLPVRCTV